MHIWRPDLQHRRHAIHCASERSGRRWATFAGGGRRVRVGTVASSRTQVRALPWTSLIHKEAGGALLPWALTRKNALFAGHERGAAGWPMVASLLETCKLNQADPLAWTTDVLTKLVNRWPASRIDELMPWAYAAKSA
jgi:hypothetical protein